MLDPRTVHQAKVKEMYQLVKEIRALEVVIPLLEEPEKQTEEPNVEV
jgi:hypothetical protein